MAKSAIAQRSQNSGLSKVQSIFRYNFISCPTAVQMQAVLGGWDGSLQGHAGTSCALSHCISLLLCHVLSLAVGLMLGHGRIDFPPRGKGRETVEERRDALRHRPRATHLS